MIAFDTSTILLALDPKCRPPIDPATGKPLTHCRDRVDNLIKTISNAKLRILIPTPVLSEFLVKAGPNKAQYVEELAKSPVFRIEPFDSRAAIELAEMTSQGLKPGKKLTSVESKAKLKFDRQIVAIAKVNQVTAIYTDDKKLAAVAKSWGIPAVLTWELELPKNTLQLPFEEPSSSNVDRGPDWGSFG